LAGAVVALAVTPAGASAALVEPPPLPHLFTVFPDRDFVSVEGYHPGENLAVRVLRDGVQIGAATGAAGPDGIFEVNHPGGACWTGSTPNIMAQDKVVVAPAGSANDVGEATTTADLHATAAVEDTAGRIVIHGTARNANGSPIDLGLIEQRIVNPAFGDVGLPKRDIRAVSDGSGEGTLTPDPVGPGNLDGTRWTAVYSGLTQAQRDAAVAGQTRVLGWQRTTAAGDRLGVTIHEVGEVGGPGVGGCPQGADYAVTSSDHPAVTKAMVDAAEPLVLSGVSQDASAVSVRLSDLDSNTPDITHDATPPTPAPGAATVAQTWTVAFTAAEVAGLADGTLTARGAYAVGAATVNGKELSIAKDVVLPGAPDATPGTGTYASAQAVTLDKPDPASVIHYTANGTTPTAASPIAPAQLLISSSQVIRAVAVDAVGNSSAISTFAYTITGPASGGGPGSGGSGSLTGGPSASNSAAGAAPGLGQVLSAVARSTGSSLALANLTVSRRISVTRLRAQGLRASMRLPNGTEAIRFAVYRTRNGSPTGTALATGSREASRAGNYRLTLRSRALLRKLNPGTYVLQVRPGHSRSDLGRTSTVAFTVTR
jgi:hypothetical protein